MVACNTRAQSDNLKIRQSGNPAILKAAGIRPSKARLAIFENLLGRMDHPTAEQVFQSLAKAMPTLSRTTVYTTLKLFCEKGLANQIPTGEIEMRFDGKTSLHAHLLCRVCGRLHDAEITGGSFPQIATPEGFEIESPQLVYRGICAKCRKT